LDAAEPADVPTDAVAERVEELMRSGFKVFDAFHVACAERAAADVFLTCDDRLLAAARRPGAALAVRCLNPVDLLAELYP
jgi:predicted nucleic acid-binding protein